MQQPNSRTYVEVTAEELPLSCPTPDSPLWNSHPKVFIPLEDAPQASCPYCGTVYRLVAQKSSPIPEDSALEGEVAGKD